MSGVSKEALDIRNLLLHECGWCGAARQGERRAVACDGCTERRYCNEECREDHMLIHRAYCGKAQPEPDTSGDNSTPYHQLFGPFICYRHVGDQPAFLAAPGDITVFQERTSGNLDPGLMLDVPVAHALGLPLRTVPSIEDEAQTNCHPIEALGLDIDPESPRFGKRIWASPFPPRATWILYHMDENGLHCSFVHALCLWARYASMIIDHKQAEGKLEEDFQRSILVYQLLSKRAVDLFVQETRLYYILSDPQAWLNVLCPINDDAELRAAHPEVDWSDHTSNLDSGD